MLLLLVFYLFIYFLKISFLNNSSKFQFPNLISNFQNSNTGAYFCFGWDFYISIDLHDHSHLRDTCWVDDLFLFYDDSLVEHFLNHSVRLILSDIFMILWWSYLRRMDSHIIISIEYTSDLLYIPIELFSSYQDRPDALVAILGHISLF